MPAPRPKSPGLDAAQRQVLIDLCRGVAGDLAAVLLDLEDMAACSDDAGLGRRLWGLRDQVGVAGAALDDAADALGGSGRTCDWSRHAGVLRALREVCK